MLTRSRLLSPDGAGGGLTPIVERDLTTDNAEPLVKTVVALRERVNELTARENGGRRVQDEEWRKVDDGLKAMATKADAQEKELGRLASMKMPATPELAIQRAAMTLQIPDDDPLLRGTSRELFNLLALAPEELVNVGELGPMAWAQTGIDERVARFASDPARARTFSLVHDLQRVGDIIYMTDVMLRGRGHSNYASMGGAKERMSTQRLWPEWQRLCKEVSRGMSEGTANVGAEWVPTILSSQLFGLIQAETKVAALFPQLTMTSRLLDWPVLTGDSTAYYVAETTVADGTGVPTPYKSSTPPTAKATWTAKKLFVRILTSMEFDEDSVITAAPFITQNIAKVIARSTEDALISGDVARTMDLATNATDHPRSAWNGMRYFPVQVGSYAAKVDKAGATAASADIWSMKEKMKIYGAVPDRGAFIVGYHGLRILLSLVETITMEKFGPMATILRGQIGQLMGSPIILSDFVPETDNAANSGKTSATAANNTRGTILYVQRDTFGIGQRRGVTLKSSDQVYMESDMQVFVGAWRGDFEPFTVPTATNCPVGAITSIL